MENDLTAIAEQYEKKIRGGFPAGELRSELLQKGYSEAETDTIIAEIKKMQTGKSSGRQQSFRFVLGSISILAGLWLLKSPQKVYGIFLIVSGTVKIIYDLFFEKKKDLAS